MDRLPDVTSAKFESLNLIPSNIYKFSNALIRDTLLSCKIDSSNVPFSCYEMGHSWDESCFNSAAYLFFGCVKEGLNIYGLLYLVTALLRRRTLKYFLTKLPQEVIRSTVFLAANCFYFLIFFCLGRKTFGRISYWGLLLSNLPACFLSIIIERKQRRGLLALYLANLATETGFNMMVDRKWLKSINNGQVLLFAIVSSVYVYLFRRKSLDGGLFNIIKMFLGSEEINDVHAPAAQRKSRIVKYYGFITEILNNIINLTTRKQTGQQSEGKLYTLMRTFEIKLDNFLNKLSIAHGRKHNLCSHRYSCILYSIKGFIQRFLAGFLLQAGIKFAGSIVQILKKPKTILKILTNPVNVELGLFFGSFNLIYRACQCLLRWLTNKNNKYHAVIAGYFAGWSMMFYKSSSITLYLTFKLFEVLWMLGVKSNKLPLYKNFDIVLYTIATAFILWVGVFEPHNIRQQYWKFLVKISSNKFAEVNRHILDVFGTKASTIYRTCRPKYDPSLSMLNSHIHS